MTLTLPSSSTIGKNPKALFLNGNSPMDKKTPSFIGYKPMIYSGKNNLPLSPRANHTISLGNEEVKYLHTLISVVV